MEGVCYDPRLVTFEFLSGIVLRKKQAAKYFHRLGFPYDYKSISFEWIMGVVCV